MINEIEVKCLARKYGFTVNIINRYVVTINSKYDSWYVEEVGGDKPLQLYHKNRIYNRDKYHKQKKFFDFPFLFKSIYEHDKYKIKKLKSKRNDRLDYLFNQISRSHT